MDLKKVSGKFSAKKKKKMMTIELKREIIEKHEQGVRVIDLSRQYERSMSTISTVLKQKELIKGIKTAKGVTIISKLRTSLHENMEKLLMMWMKEKQLQGDTLTQTIICKKARAIYGDLLKQNLYTSTDEASEDLFKASRGWFENFKKRTGIHSIGSHDEAASSDVKVVEDYLTLSELIKSKGYIIPVEEEIVSLEKSMDLEVGEREVNELVEEHAQELTTEGTQKLQSQQHTEVLQEIGFEKPEEEEVISTSEIKEILRMWEKVSQFVKKKHPEKIATGRALELFNDTCITHFRNILKGRKKQTSLDMVFFKRPTGESEKSVAKKAKTSEEKRLIYEMDYRIKEKLPKQQSTSEETAIREPHSLLSSSKRAEHLQKTVSEQNPPEHPDELQFETIYIKDFVVKEEVNNNTSNAASNIVLKQCRVTLVPLPYAELLKYGISLNVDSRKLSNFISTYVINLKNSGEKPLQCDHCSYSCARVEQLKRHILKHTGKKPYQCDQCSYTCAHLEHLSRHRTKHSGERPYQCDQSIFTPALVWDI